VIGEIGRSATVGWSPTGPYIAAGTMAGAIDDSFAASSALEILRLDAATGKLTVAAAVACPERFYRVAWAAGDGALVAGGLDDGGLRIWDAKALLRDAVGADGSPGSETKHVVYGRPTSTKRHTSGVRGLDFNPFNTALLASGAAEGELLVWDLGSKEGPKVHSMAASAAGKNQSSGGEITALAWNRRVGVEHILASTSSVGVTTVWDLRQKKQVITIRDPRGRARTSALAWNPAVATQMALASDDDAAKAIQLWDLRNATSPVREYTHHQGGVMAMSWCSHDTELLLTTGKDSRTCVVSAATGDVLCEAPRGSNWNFDVQWSPAMVGVFSMASFEGRLSVHGLLASSSASAPSFSSASALADSFNIDASEFTASSPRMTSGNVMDMVRPPQWLKRPVGCAFGFGGRVVQFSKPNKTQVSLTPTVTDPEMVRANHTLEEQLRSASPDDLRRYCEELAKADSDPFAWEVLKMQFEVDARRKLIALLGLKPPANKSSEPETAVGLELCKPLAHRFVLKQEDSDETPLAEEPVGTPSAPPLSTLTEDDLSGPAPWDMGDDAAPATENGWDESIASGESQAKIESKVEAPSAKEDIDSVLRQAILIGDFEAAVSACIDAGRQADALMLAHCGGPKLWLTTQEKLLEDHSVPCMRRLFRTIVSPSPAPIDKVGQKDLESEEAWKEALAATVAYASATDLVQNCDVLGSRLMMGGNLKAALCFFLCSFNIKMAAHIWMKDMPLSNGKAEDPRTDRLMLLNKKIRVLATAAAMTHGESDVARVVSDDNVTSSVFLEVGALLASQGQMSAALHYVENLGQDIKGPYGTAGDMADRLRLFVSPSSTARRPTQTTASRTAGSMASRNPPTTFTTAVPPTTSAMPFQPHQPKTSYSPGSFADPPTVPSIPYGQNSAAAPPPVYTTFTPQAPTSLASTSAGPPPPPPTKQELQSRSHSVTPSPKSQSPALAPVPAPKPHTQPPIPAQPPIPTQPVVAPPSSLASSSPARRTAAPDPNEQFMMPSLPAARPGPEIQYENVGGRTAVAPPPMAAAPPPRSAPMPNYASSTAPPPIPAPIAPSQPVVSASADALSAMRNGPPSTAPAPVATQPPVGSGPPSQAATMPPPMVRPRASNTPGSVPDSAEVAGVVKMKRNMAASTSAKEPVVTLGDADVSSVPQSQQAIVRTLRDVYAQVSARNSSSVYKKKMEDVSKRLGRLLSRLNSGALDDSVIEKVQAMCDALAKEDLVAASAVVTRLSRENWDEHNHWIVAAKRLIESAKTGR